MFVFYVCFQNIQFELKVSSLNFFRHYSVVCFLSLYCLTLCLPVPSADNLGKQSGPRSGPTIRRARSGSKLFDILMVLLKELFEKGYFEKNQQTTKKHEKLPSMQ